MMSEKSLTHQLTENFKKISKVQSINFAQIRT